MVALDKHDIKLLIASCRYSLQDIEKKFYKFGKFILLSDLDDREQENYQTLRATRKKYTDMLKVLESL